MVEGLWNKPASEAQNVPPKLWTFIYQRLSARIIVPRIPWLKEPQ